MPNLLYLVILLILISPCYLHATPLEEARQAFNQGRYQQALEYWQTSLASTALDRQQRFDAQLGSAIAARHQGLYRLAAETLQQLSTAALSTATEQARLHNEFSKLYLAQGQYELAETQLAQALTFAQQAPPYLLAAVLLQQGNLYSGVGKPGEALDSYKKALPFVKNHPAMRGKLLLNQLRVIVVLQQFDNLEDAELAAVQNVATTAFDAMNGWAEQYDEMMALLGLNKILRDSPKVFGDVGRKLARQALLRASEIAEMLDTPQAKSLIYGNIGTQRQIAGDYETAITATQRALFFAQQANSPENLFQWHLQLAHLYRDEPDLDKALAEYRQAISHLEILRSSVIHTGYNSALDYFQTHIQPIYIEFADLLLQQAVSNANPPSKQKSLRRKALEIVELLRREEVQNYLQSECLLPQTGCSTLDETLEPGVAALYPMPFTERLELLLVLPDSIYQFTLPVSLSKLKIDVALLAGDLRGYTALANSSSSGCHHPAPTTAVPKIDFLPMAQTLYSQLITPIQAQLKKHHIHTLIVTPASSLRTLPFAALHDGNDFLIEQYALAISPGLRLNPPPAETQKQSNILLGGLSQMTEDMSALPCVRHELESVRDTYADTGYMLIDEAFTMTGLSNEIKQRPYHIIHLATHGRFSGNAEKSFLRTWDDDLHIGALEKLLRQAEIINGTSVDLLTLSACETAISDERAALGMAGIALQAGVRSALAGLWQVDDAATAALMIEFYQRLTKPNVTKAQALQGAQYALIHDEKFAAYRHPYHWAGFILTGRWQ